MLCCGGRHWSRPGCLLVGDTRQLSAVEAGNPFKSLQAGGMTTAYLETHRRQQNGVLRSAVELVAQGQVSEGIELLAQAGCVKEGAQPQERIQQVAADYLALKAEERESTLVLAGTNMERLALTQAMRSGYRMQGALGADGFVMQSLRRKDLTTPRPVISRLTHREMCWCRFRIIGSRG
jgi:ATP-dependent exoDNAse (exonuclease V) alpha subunit